MGQTRATRSSSLRLPFAESVLSNRAELSRLLKSNDGGSYGTDDIAIMNDGSVSVPEEVVTVTGLTSRVVVGLVAMDGSGMEGLDSEQAEPKKPEPEKPEPEKPEPEKPEPEKPEPEKPEPDKPVTSKPKDGDGSSNGGGSSQA